MRSRLPHGVHETTCPQGTCQVQRDCGQRASGCPSSVTLSTGCLDDGLSSNKRSCCRRSKSVYACLAVMPISGESPVFSDALQTRSASQPLQCQRDRIIVGVTGTVRYGNMVPPTSRSQQCETLGACCVLRASRHGCVRCRAGSHHLKRTRALSPCSLRT